jgi:hypothetical protein
MTIVISLNLRWLTVEFGAGLACRVALDPYGRRWDDQNLGLQEYVISSDEKTSIELRLAEFEKALQPDRQVLPLDVHRDDLPPDQPARTAEDWRPGSYYRLINLRETSETDHLRWGVGDGSGGAG